MNLLSGMFLRRAVSWNSVEEGGRYYRAFYLPFSVRCPFLIVVFVLVFFDVVVGWKFRFLFV
jgi:hypothetical protein